MHKAEQCASCGASLQYRDKQGNICCAYCGRVMYLGDEPEPAPEYRPRDVFSMGRRTVAVCGSYVLALNPRYEEAGQPLYTYRREDG